MSGLLVIPDKPFSGAFMSSRPSRVADRALKWAATRRPLARSSHGHSGTTPSTRRQPDRRSPLLLDCRLQAPRQCRAQRPDVLEFDAAAPADDLHAPAHPVLCLGDELLG